MRALVLSGGGSHGAWQAGVLAQLLEDGSEWDLICGVSVGAINTLGLAYGLPPEAFEELWGSLRSNRDVYEWAHFWSPLTAPWRSGLYSMAPLRKLLTKHVQSRTPRRDRTYLVQAVHLGLGQMDSMLLTGDRDLDVRQVLRSASYPVAFETQEGYSDGGVRDVTPLGLAIQWGATDIDAIVCARSGVPIWDTKDRGLLATAERILSIILDEVVVNDLAVCREHNQRILEGRGDSGKRLVNLNVWMPQNPLGYGSLDFDGPKLLEAFNQGRTDVHCKKLSYLRRATVAAVPKACSSYRPWGIKSDEEGRSIDPSDCYVCGMGPKAHQG